MFKNVLIGILTVILAVACAPNKDKKRNIRPASAMNGKPKGADTQPQKGGEDSGPQGGSTAKIPGADSNAPLNLNGDKDGEKDKDKENVVPQTKVEDAIKEYNEANERVTELYRPINVQLGVNSISELAYEGFDKDIIANEISSESVVLMNDSVDQLIKLEKAQLQRLQQIEKSGYYGNYDKKLVLDIISKVNIKLEILEELALWIKERIKSETQSQ